MTDAETPAPQEAAAIENDLAPSDEERRRRRKLLILFFLALIAIVISLILGWYLIFRKPLEQILPPITLEQVPHYSFSIYDLDHPIGVAVTADGSRIYVSEAGGERVVRVYDRSGDEIGQLVPPDTTPASRVPVYIAIEPATQDVYVSDRLSASIDIFGSDGSYKGVFEPSPAIPAWQPLGLAFDAAGTLYVSDVAGPTHRILAFGPDRQLVRTLATTSSLSFPNGLAVDALGDVAIADGNNGRLLILSSTDGVVGTIPRGFSTGELALPRGAAIDDSGRLYVSDTSGHVVQMYRLDPKSGVPTYIATFGREGTTEGGFEYPHGLAVDTRAHIYIADWANDRLAVWSY